MRRLRRRFWDVARPIEKWVSRQFKRPRVGHTDFGDLRRLRPISSVWGADRGQVLDRYYIERFLECNAGDIRGHVLEIGTADYTRRFGGSRVTKGDVLHVADELPDVTIVDDLTSAKKIESETFDCVICTQTLQFIYDYSATVATLRRILKKGGVLLVTFPGISKISREDMDRWGHYWAFTTRSAQTIFEREFSRDNVAIEAFGNVLAAAAFLFGLSADELNAEELDYCDPDYEVLISVRAIRRQ